MAQHLDILGAEIRKQFDALESAKEESVTNAKEQVTENYKIRTSDFDGKVANFTSDFESLRRNAEDSINEQLKQFTEDVENIVQNGGGVYKGLTQMTQFINNRKDQFEKFVKGQIEAINNTFQNWTSEFGTEKEFNSAIDSDWGME